jgi:hypothetical protein
MGKIWLSCRPFDLEGAGSRPTRLTGARCVLSTFDVLIIGAGFAGIGATTMSGHSHRMRFVVGHFQYSDADYLHF